MTAIFTILLLLAMTIPAMAASAVNKDGYYKGIIQSATFRFLEKGAVARINNV